MIVAEYKNFTESFIDTFIPAGFGLFNFLLFQIPKQIWELKPYVPSLIPVYNRSIGEVDTYDNTGIYIISSWIFGWTQKINNKIIYINFKMKISFYK